MRTSRFHLGLLDQIFSSGSNLLPLFAVARVADVDGFGQVTLALVALTSLMAICRGFLGSSLTLLAHSKLAVLQDGRYALLSSLLAGSVSTLLMVFVSLAFDAQPVVFAIAVSTPFVLTQDVYRYIAIATGETGKAIAADFFWFSVSLALLGSTFAPSALMSPVLIYALWASAGAVGALYLSCTLKLAPKLSGLTTWLRQWDRDRCRLGSEATLGATLSIIQAAAVTAILGTAAMAALRGSASILGPLSLVIGSMSIALVPELRRRKAESVDELWRSVRWIAWTLVSASVLIGLASTTIPVGLGRSVLGDSWSVVMPLIAVTAVEYVFQSWIAVHNTVFRAKASTGYVLALRIVLSGGGTAAAVIAALTVETAYGVAWALALNAGTAAVIATMIRRSR